MRGQVLTALQSRVVLATEMYHTASLMHDDVSDRAIKYSIFNLISILYIINIIVYLILGHRPR